MVKNKAWDWSRTDDDIWHIPSEDSHYLLNYWKQKGYVKFLDLGCGLGRHSFQFAEAGFSVFALDLSVEAVDFVRKKASLSNLQIQAFKEDMTNMPFENESMDCLLAFHVLSHTDTPGMQKVISEIERVVKPGGEVFVTLCSKDAWSFKEAGFPVIDDNSVMKVEDGPENGIPHFFADREIIDRLFTGFNIQSLKHTQDIIVEGEEYGSWHYFIKASRKS